MTRDNMKNIGIIVGEDADLPQILIGKLPIDIFPFVVNPSADGHKTSQPSPKTLEELFKKNLKIYKYLLVITISSLLSGTYNSAMQAKSLFKKHDQKRIHVIDSRTSTGAEGLIVLKIAELIKFGKPKDEILLEIDEIILKAQLLGAFDDPSYLERGGRINKVQSLVIKNMLKAGFRPILTVKDGKIKTKKIHRERSKAKALFFQFREELNSVRDPSSRLGRTQDDNVSVAITHLDCEKDAKELKKLVQSYNKNIKIKYVTSISPVIGAHLGPGSLILSWLVY